MRVFGSKVPEKYGHMYRKLRIDHIRIKGQLISTLLTLGFWQIVLNWKHD